MRSRRSLLVMTNILAGALAAMAGEGRREIAQAMMPYTITNAGSYVVTENLTGSAAANGITIAASDVTLDLNGFQVAGVGSSLDGIGTSGSRLNIHIVNGIVRGWGGDGIDLRSASNSALRQIIAYGNTGDGLRLGDAGQVRDCNVYQNTGDGVDVDEAVTLDRIVARQNGGHGIFASNGCVIANSVLRENGIDGIRAGLGCTILACATRSNEGDGIRAGPGSQISDSVGYSNDDGIRIAGRGGNVVNCSAFGNLLYGIRVQDGGAVTHSVAAGNELGGIQAGTNCFVSGNTCYQNGTNSATSAGVHVSGRGNRIEGNHAGESAYGFHAPLATNLIVRNSATQNDTNYVAAAANKTGPLTGDPSVTNSWVNFDF
jgi:hypothetical protein